MKLKEMSKEELENMSYDDLAYALITEKGKKMKIIDLFNAIGKLIGLSDSKIEQEIGDFFEMLTLDKRFVMLDDGSWDLREKHAQNIIIEEDEEELSIEKEEDEEEEEREEETIFYDEDDSDDQDDDLKDLVIIDDEEEDSI